MFQAIANLLDNAIKFAPNDSEVRISLATEAERATVTVADQGPGIPAGERDKVIDRFYRRESSRSTPGSGLGLSLVAAVARLHGATLSFHDNEPGLRAELSFPTTRTESPSRPGSRP